MDGIIFDVDGTLWDSTEVVSKAWTGYLREKEGLDILVTADRLRSLFGRLLSDIARDLFPHADETEQERLIVACEDEEHRALLREHVDLYPGMEKTIRTLAERFPLFIVSNCEAGYIEVFLENSGLGDCFTGHLCPGDTGLAKAGNIRRIAEIYGLSSPCYVGDTQGDYDACMEAGVDFIFAAYGFGQVPDAKVRIQSPSELPGVFSGSAL